MPSFANHTPGAWRQLLQLAWLTRHQSAQLGYDRDVKGLAETRLDEYHVGH